MSHLLKESVGAADKPLRLLHLSLEVGDSLHRRQAGDSCANFGPGRENPSFPFKKEAAQLAGSRALQVGTE